MELCWNDSKTAESIKEARAVCTHGTLDAEALCSTTVKEAKAICACTIQEAEAVCSAAIRDAGQIIQEESKSQIDFLSICQAALQASPADLRGALVASYHVLMGQAPTFHLFTLSQGASDIEQLSAPAAPSSLGPEHSPRPKRWHPSPDPVDNMPLGGTTSKTTLEGPLSSKWQEIPSWYKVLKWSHSEAFSQGTSLVREARKEYFKKHSPQLHHRGHA